MTLTGREFSFEFMGEDYGSRVIIRTSPIDSEFAEIVHQRSADDGVNWTDLHSLPIMGGEELRELAKVAELVSDNFIP